VISNQSQKCLIVRHAKNLVLNKCNQATIYVFDCKSLIVSNSKDIVVYGVGIETIICSSINVTMSGFTKHLVVNLVKPQHSALIQMSFEHSAVFAQNASLVIGPPNLYHSGLAKDLKKLGLKLKFDYQVLTDCRESASYLPPSKYSLDEIPVQLYNIKDSSAEERDIIAILPESYRQWLVGSKQILEKANKLIAKEPKLRGMIARSFNQWLQKNGMDYEIARFMDLEMDLAKHGIEWC
jgi:hypothetical protein